MCRESEKKREKKDLPTNSSELYFMAHGRVSARVRGINPNPKTKGSDYLTRERLNYVIWRKSRLQSQLPKKKREKNSQKKKNT